ncbi:NTP transferase domain-containing protein [Pseudohalocynthiibacter aestuariivivens]|jgi:molybdenum cofactor cytidylyltransferase|uniref:NTP transferase domain-containing protein n=1 Tax=Pseudohalocynthiibacter aestuariivivens TaxID=1591409 RepID=A0ABV5JG66_9RHOB|nr:MULTISPECIES: nucleotidyltransferase family protein [Pseudohalocynthiibacter]MBS9716209.1 nucleotidyltransferase family protein [Pseudohalocynthiibacter aestuariivivens]MCK0100984.1 nucleotidyltransferase family protein [Pseudohalocynthiibacter sp. F2068]
MTKVAIVMLAAGASNRMRGRDKLLENIQGTPLLRQSVKRAAATGSEVYVTLPCDAPERLAAVARLPVTLVFVKDASDGMAHSLSAAIKAVPKDSDGVLISLADMPELTESDFTRIIKAFSEDSDQRIHRAYTEGGKPGHPVLFPRRLFPALSNLTGDIGARQILNDPSEDIVHVTLSENHAITDLDTPEDWDNWRTGKKTGR